MADTPATASLAVFVPREDVAVTDDGDGSLALDLADEIPVGGSGVSLILRPSVDDDGGGARVFHSLGERGRGRLGRSSSQSNLHRQRKRNAVGDAAHESLEFLGFLEEGGAEAAFPRLVDGASAVEVEEIGAGVRGEATRGDALGDLVRGDLDAKQTLALVPAESRELDGVLLQDEAREDHLADGDVAPEIHAQAAEREVSTLGQGREHELAVELAPEVRHGLVRHETLAGGETVGDVAELPATVHVGQLGRGGAVPDGRRVGGRVGGGTSGDAKRASATRRVSEHGRSRLDDARVRRPDRLAPHRIARVRSRPESAHRRTASALHVNRRAFTTSTLFRLPYQPSILFHVIG